MSESTTDSTAGRTVPCPFCGEQILAVAVRCKHCRSDINTPASANSQQQPCHQCGASVVAAQQCPTCRAVRGPGDIAQLGRGAPCRQDGTALIDIFMCPSCGALRSPLVPQAQQNLPPPQKNGSAGARVALGLALPIGAVVAGMAISVWLQLACAVIAFSIVLAYTIPSTRRRMRTVAAFLPEKYPWILCPWLLLWSLATIAAIADAKFNHLRLSTQLANRAAGEPAATQTATEAEAQRQRAVEQARLDNWRAQDQHPVAAPNEPTNSAPAQVASVPSFVAQRQATCAQFEAATNDIRKSAVFTDFFKSWKKASISELAGTLKEIETPHGGGTVLVTIETNFGTLSNNDISFGESPYDIKKGSKLYRDLGDLENGSPVVLSASNIVPDKNPFSEHISVCGDKWLAKFTSIRAAK